MPSFNTALIPITAQSDGMIKRYFENFLSQRRKKPNVKIVVGQGNPMEMVRDKFCSMR